jgi:hypothetical protein
MKKNNSTQLAIVYRLLVSTLVVLCLVLTHDLLLNKWNKDNIWSFIPVVPPLLIALGFYHFSKRYDGAHQKPFTVSESLKSIIKNKTSFIWGVLSIALIAGVNMAILAVQADAVYLLTSYGSVPKILNAVISAGIYALANVYMFVGVLNFTKRYIKPFWIVPFYAVLQILVSTIIFKEDSFALILLHFVLYLNIGYIVASNQKDFALGSYFAFCLLPARLVCDCVKIVSGIFAFSGVAEMGYTPAFLYSFQLVAMGAVAAYYGRLAYIMNLGKDFVDKGYMMVTDKHGVGTPMLRSTYQYSVMKEIKPWIAITEADKKRRRGMVIGQPLQKGWSFYEVFNAQGECLTHGFIDANMDISHLPKGYLQDNRPKLAIAWELDTDALYYLRVEFEGETLYGALRMFFNAEERAKQPQTFAYKLSNTWIHPNEEEILSCVLYKASGEEVLVKALYGKYHDN